MAAPWEISAAQPPPPPATTAPWETPPPVNAGPSPSPPSADWHGIPGNIIDWAKNIGTGAEQAVADVAGLPRLIQDLGKSDFAQKWLPYPVQSVLQASQILPFTPPTTSQAQQAITGFTGLNYVPRTPEGRIVQRAAEFGTGGLLGGPLDLTAGALAAGGGAAQQAATEAGAPDWLSTGLGILTPLLAHAGTSAIRTLARPTTDIGHQAAAGQVIRESMDNPNAVTQPPPIADPAFWPDGQIRQTAGQAFGDPTLQSFEQGRFQSSDQMRTQFGQIKQAANQAGTNVLNTVGNFPNRAEAGPQALTASAGMQQETQDALAAAQTAETNAWHQVDPNRLTAFDTVALKQNVNNYINGLAPGPSGRILAKAVQQYIPADTVKTINSLNPTEPLDELQQLRSSLSTEARNLRASGTQDNQANVVEGLRDIVANHVDNLMMPDPSLTAAYDNARLLTQQLHNTFDSSLNPATKLVQRVLKSPTGSTTAGTTFMSTPEGFNAYYNATGGSQQAIQHAQDYFLAGLARKSLGTGEQMAPTSYTAYLNQPANQALLNDRRLFTQQQADSINQVAAQLDHTAQTGRVGQEMGGSQTYRLLSSGEQAKALAGAPAQVAANLAGKLKEGAGTWIGAHFGGPLGAVAGFLASHAIPDFTYEKAGQKVLDYVDKALANPVLADRLRQLQLPSTSATLPAALKAATVPILLGGGSR